MKFNPPPPCADLTTKVFFIWKPQFTFFFFPVLNLTVNISTFLSNFTLKNSSPSSRGCSLSNSLNSLCWKEDCHPFPECCFCCCHNAFYFEVYLQNLLFNRVRSHMPSSLRLCISTKCLHFFEDLSTFSTLLL